MRKLTERKEKKLEAIKEERKKGKKDEKEGRIRKE